ncbi:MAG: type II and III secretion system protein [Planctomycetes bacterium]|nr:type II and III secretion system protein [Planctomycetota bacterium]
MLPRPHGVPAVLFTILLLAGAFSLLAQDPPPPPVAPDPAAAPEKPGFMFEKGRIEKDGIVTLFYRIGHDRGAVIKPLLERWKTPQGSIETQEKLHILMVSDVKENIPLLEKVLEILDAPEPQVLIETRVIEVTTDEDFQFGLETNFVPRFRQYGAEADAFRIAQVFMQEIGDRFNPADFLEATRPGGPGANFFQGATIRFATASTDNTGLMSFTLRALLDTGKAQILSNPRILVASGDSATITSGAQVPIQTTNFQNNQTYITVDFKPVNITLTVGPHIIGEQYVHLKVSSKVEDIIATQQIQGVQTPIISSRSADTEVTVKDGEMIVIGGLKRHRDLRSERGVPLLGSIPILGHLFKSTRHEGTQSELIFYLRPLIIRGETGENIQQIIQPPLPWEEDEKQ